MNKAIATREKLLTEGRRLLWSRGYSNVSLREIAQAAGVDVALISRYFGSKRGLFEATIDGAFATPHVSGPDELVELIVAMFTQTPRDTGVPSVLQLMLMNAHDEVVGEHVRSSQRDAMQADLERVLGDRARAALLMAVVLGISVAEKSLHLDGIAPYDSAAYEKQLRHLIGAALAFDDS